MKAARWLRASSVLSVVFALGHTLGASQSWSPIGDTDVLRAMAAFRFDVEGATRSYLDFYRGFGLLLSVYLFLQALILWQLAAIAKQHIHLTRPLIGTFLAAQLLSAILAWSFIFPMPAVLCLVVAGCIAVSLHYARMDSAANHGS